MEKFMTLFGGALISILAVLLITFFNHTLTSISDCRNDFNANMNNIKSGIENNVNTIKTSVESSNKEVIGIKEKLSGMETKLEVITEIKNDFRELQTLKERQAALNEQVLTIKDQLGESKKTLTTSP